MNIKQIAKIAKKFQRKAGGMPTFETAEKYINKQGYSIIIFDADNEEIKLHNLTEIAKNKDSFVYETELKLIFIRQALDENKKLRLLLHEIGHILLEHLNNKVLTAEEKEREAETFVQYLLVPIIIQKQYSLVTILVLCAALLCSVVYNFKLHTIYKDLSQSAVPAFSQLPESDTRTVESEALQEETVQYFYVTRTGKRYHTEHCMYAKNAIQVSEDYATSYYLPCGYCNPQQLITSSGMTSQ